MKFWKDRNPANTSAGRFMGIHTIVHDGVDYMTRVWFWRFRFHRFHRGDKDHDCHDHPWNFITFPLTSYVEEILEPIRETVAVQDADLPPKRFFKTPRVVKRFRFHYRPAEFAHRVVGAWNGQSGLTMKAEDMITPGKKINTLVYQSGKRRSWGFHKNRDGKWCWQPWREYALNGGRNQPCS